MNSFVRENFPFFSPVCRCDGDIPFFWLLNAQVDWLKWRTQLVGVVLLNLKWCFQSQESKK